MLTAQEALALKEMTTEEKAAAAVEKLLVAVKEIAKTKTFLLTGWGYKQDEEIWIHGGYSIHATHNNVYKAACNLLHQLGYTTFFYYEERQFVDMFTIISWGDKTAEMIAKEIQGQRDK